MTDRLRIAATKAAELLEGPNSGAQMQLGVMIISKYGPETSRHLSKG